MYEGHLPASGIQRHSAGELFPCFIVIYGNGEARWVNPEKQVAGYRLPNHRDAAAACRAAIAAAFYRDVDGLAWLLRREYLNYCLGG